VLRWLDGMPAEHHCAAGGQGASQLRAAGGEAPYNAPRRPALHLERGGAISGDCGADVLIGDGSSQ
jgi:hypothetical protein